MSLTNIAGERPVHFPANPAAFAFDSEVSRIFPDMAKRSIPNFYESHAAHAAMLRPLLAGKSEVKILDIGASRGAMTQSLVDEFGIEEAAVRFDIDAVDSSADMVAMHNRDYPWAKARVVDITTPEFTANRRRPDDLYDVVCMHYVLQFVPSHMQDSVIRAVVAKIKPGGILIFGHKSAHYGALGEAAHEQYIQFRMRNGYTREEIEAKTKALKGSMFATDHEILTDWFRHHFTYVQETFRFMMFSTLMAVK